MKQRTMLLASLGATAALAATAFAAPVAQGGQKFTTELTGEAEVPPADLDGTGTASITVNPGQKRICWEITTANIDTVAAAHIHSGVAGANGGIVVHLSATANGTASGCTTTVQPGGAALTRDLIDAIRKAPQAFYVNVHTTVFPGGAIRGQLG